MKPTNSAGLNLSQLKELTTSSPLHAYAMMNSQLGISAPWVSLITQDITLLQKEEKSSISTPAITSILIPSKRLISMFGPIMIFQHSSKVLSTPLLPSCTMVLTLPLPETKLGKLILLQLFSPRIQMVKLPATMTLPVSRLNTFLTDNALMKLTCTWPLPWMLCVLRKLKVLNQHNSSKLFIKILLSHHVTRVWLTHTTLDVPLIPHSDLLTSLTTTCGSLELWWSSLDFSLDFSDKNISRLLSVQ